MACELHATRFCLTENLLRPLDPGTLKPTRMHARTHAHSFLSQKPPSTTRQAVMKFMFSLEMTHDTTTSRERGSEISGHLRGPPMTARLHWWADWLLEQPVWWYGTHGITRATECCLPLGRIHKHSAWACLWNVWGPMSSSRRLHSTRGTFQSQRLREVRTPSLFSLFCLLRFTSSLFFVVPPSLHLSLSLSLLNRRWGWRKFSNS